MTTFFTFATRGEDLPIVKGVEFQPLAAQAQRVVEALDYLGQPLAPADKKAVLDACRSTDEDRAIGTIQAVLDRYCLVGVNINPESRVKAQAGPLKKELVQQGWRAFLVKVHNEAGVTAELRVSSPNAAPLFKRSTGRPDPKFEVKPGDAAHRFLQAEMYNKQPLNRTLSGLAVEYRILQLYCRDVGKREATLAFDVGQGTQDIGFRNETSLLFEAVPSTEVVLEVLDDDGSPTMGSFIFRDRFGNIYPFQQRRLAPDFFFHPQVYRQSGESVHLPAGQYTVEYGRGPEYIIDRRTIRVPQSVSHKETFRLRRWIEPKKAGWYSGDHHVHAAGCAHYENPSEGVTPADMFRHALGEDLNVSCVLSWGPCWYFQKQFFEGDVHHFSQKHYLMRYDVEVSGFPSQDSGHLCLLNLRDDDYTYPQDVEFDWSFGGEKGRFSGRRTERIGEWPSWDLPILQWGKRQGGVVGFSHSGWGLDLGPTKELPNFTIPPFNGIGANEYIVDVVHDACDFISTVDTPPVWELNIWYHTLNCGYRCRISGETDFPCIYGERIGLGRVYVKLDGELNYQDWVMGIKNGRSYVSDGLSHLIDFRVNGLGVGEKGSQVDLEDAGVVKVTAKAAALLDERPNEAIRNAPLHHKPYWHVERARIGNSRKVPVELVVNGLPAAKMEIEADGALHDISFEAPIKYSSWVALRIFPSSHTNPVFVHVGDKPIRASRRSAEWCMKSVDQCWSQKSPRIRPWERPIAQAAYDTARAAYRKILEESVAD
jgi:hypothetical protein